MTMSTDVFRGGIEAVDGGYAVFGTDDGRRVNLGIWPEYDEACDIYSRWSEAHPRPPRARPSHNDMLADIQRVRKAAKALFNDRPVPRYGLAASPDAGDIIE